jgi:hypothetical protein
MIRERRTFFRGCSARRSSVSTVSGTSGRSGSGDRADVKDVSGIAECEWSAGWDVRFLVEEIPFMSSRRGGYIILKEARPPVIKKNSELKISIQYNVKRKTSMRF